MTIHFHKTSVDQAEGDGTSLRSPLRTVSVNVGTCGKTGDTTTDTAAVTCGNCKRSKAFKVAAASWENITPAPQGTACGWKASGACQSGGDAVHVLTATLPIAAEGTALCAFHSPYDVLSEDRTDIPCVFCPDFTGTLVSVQEHTDDLHMAGDGSGRTREQYRADMAAHDAMYDDQVSYMVALGVTDDRERTAILERAWDETVAGSGNGHFYYGPEFNRLWLDIIGGLIATAMVGRYLVANNWPFRIVTADADTVTVMDRVTGERHSYSSSLFMAHVMCGTFRPFVIPEDTGAMLRPFRTSGKVKSTTRARRFRRGA